MKKVFSLLLALMLVMSLAVPAAAAENEGILTIFGTKEKIDFSCTPGVQTATDLFDDGFKNVMPGDKITGYVNIKGNFKTFNEDSLKVWMRAMTHSATDNKPVHTGITDVDHMNDFLSLLTLRVYNESKDGVKIFEGKANELDGLKENVYLGSFRNKGAIKLRVELDVPITMGNEFANDIGEVDWVFTVEAYDDPSVDNPKTGDYILRVALPVMAISGAALLLVFFRKKKQRQ